MIAEADSALVASRNTLKVMSADTDAGNLTFMSHITLLFKFMAQTLIRLLWQQKTGGYTLVLK
jgi:hypothetical protein